MVVGAMKYWAETVRVPVRVAKLVEKLALIRPIVAPANAWTMGQEPASFDAHRSSNDLRDATVHGISPDLLV